MKTLDELQYDAHKISHDKGWWEPYRNRNTDRALLVLEDGIAMTDDELVAKLALIATEVSEAIECVRDGDLETRITDTGKPEGLPTELADVVVRVMDLAWVLGFNLQQTIEQKMAYNKTRKHRHGGRRL